MSNDYRAYSEDYDNSIRHFGVIGMKWGVRRYQNYDGSYTQNGLEHYRKAEKKYDRANDEYKKTKDLYKKGPASKAGKNAVKEAKVKREAAKREMKLHYDLLKNDKLADQGKDLYSRGITITDGTPLSRTMGYILTGLGALEFANLSGNIPPKVKMTVQNKLHIPFDTALHYATGGSAVVKALMEMSNYDRSKKLRAYYAHRKHPEVKD